MYDEYGGVVDKVEEGRIALHQLERHLKDPAYHANSNLDAVSVGSRQQSLKSERSLLDQNSRDTRLHYRKDSPLGLTIEELDDRGLLDGGSVPKYYTSMRQKNRRPLEMRKRGERIQERDQEALTKLFDSFFHMCRTLMKRGLQLEKTCSQHDISNSGMISRKRFSAMLKNMGLPLTSKDAADITSRYVVPSTDMVDYEHLLRDLSSTSSPGGMQPSINNSGNSSGGGVHTNVLLDVKRMLVESARSLGKQQADVYSMFARWDNEGGGTVTAAQFLRVLARLHVNLSDNDQDLLVELLDTNARGRIDFENLLSFCFAEGVKDVTIGEYVNPNIEDDARSHGAETLSVVSIDVLPSMEQKSIGSTASFNRRPRTATDREREREGGYPRGTEQGQGRDRAEYMSSVENADRNAYGGSNGGKSKRSNPQRPLTASARVSSQRQQSRRDSPTKEQTDADEVYREGEGGEFVKDFGDTDNLTNLSDNGVDDLDNLDNLDNYGQRELQHSHGHGPQGASGEADNNSFNDGTLVTEAEREDVMGSPISAYQQLGHNNNPTGHSHHNSRHTHGQAHAISGGDMWNTSSLDGLTVSQDSFGGQGEISPDRTFANALGATQEPSDYLRMLALQTINTVRDMVVSRHQGGKDLKGIFQHFARNDERYFTWQDFQVGCADLRLDVSEEVAKLVLDQLSMDDGTRMCFGEFLVFAIEADWREVESMVCKQLVDQLESQGLAFSSWLFGRCFQEEESKAGRVESDELSLGLVHKSVFLSAMQRMGLRLSAERKSVCVARFDVYGSGACSAERFLRSVRRYPEWQRLEQELASAEQAAQEANTLMQRMQYEGSNHILGVTGEVISMAEYLGILPISEQHLLWIAADALKAPIPLNWTAQTDKQGRTFFYNHINNESTWDHPLDSHFRGLRDQFRTQHEREQQANGLNSRERDNRDNSGMGMESPKGFRYSDQRLNLSLAGHHGRPASDGYDRDASNTAHGHRRPQSAVDGHLHASSDNTRLPSVGQSSGGWGQQSGSPQGQVKLRRALDVVGDLSAQESAQAYATVRQPGRPSSAPSVNRDGSNGNQGEQQPQHRGGGPRQFPDQKTKNIYGSEYFNLSHYKQNGYKVEVIEEKQRLLHQGRNGGGVLQQQQQRPKSGGAMRSSSNSNGYNNGGNSGNNSHSRTQQRPSSGRASSRSSGGQMGGSGSGKTSVVDRYLYGEPQPSYLKPRESIKAGKELEGKKKPVPVRQLLSVGGVGSTPRDEADVIDSRLSDMYAPSLVEKLDALGGL